MFFMINSAISSGFFWETSTRRSLAFLYSGSRVCCNSDSDARGFAVRNRGRSRKRRIRARSVAPSASSQTTVPICFKRSIFSARKTMPPPVTIIAGSFRGNERSVSVSWLRKYSSPRFAKISSMGILNLNEIISSVSNRGNPVFSSSTFPTRDFPVPIIPIRTIDLSPSFTLQYQRAKAISKSAAIALNARIL